MSEIPKNTPALVKYLPFMRNNPPPGYFEECVRHGMTKYGKTKNEATTTERKCIAMMEAVEKFDPAQQRNLLFSIRTAYSESSKSRYLWEQYVTGNGVEIGSGGMPMAEHAIQCELSPETYAKYNAGQQQEFPAQWRSDNPSLPFKDGTMDFCTSSHLLEDFKDWLPPLTEWTRLVKVGGHIVILVPDKASWNRALRNGQPPNLAHAHEAHVGELTAFFARHFPHFTTLEDRLCSELTPDYTIMFCAKRIT